MVRTGFTVFLDARSGIEAVNGREAVERITEHETEVLVPIARSRSNQEIAEELVLSEQTVKTHIGRILTKLNLRDRAQAIVYACESGPVRPGE